MSEYCHGCGKDMWEYPEEADWCIECAPECYDHAGGYVDE